MKYQYGTFERLVYVLRKAGYRVKVMDGDSPVKMKDIPSCSDELHALVRRGDVYACFYRGSASCYAKLCGKIAADNNRCFNKWSQCPLSLTFPKDDEQECQLLEMLAYVGSDEGYDHSKSNWFQNIYQYQEKL